MLLQFSIAKTHDTITFSHKHMNIRYKHMSLMHTVIGKSTPSIVANSMVLCEVVDWCSDNALVLNASKCESMLIHCGRTQVDKHSMNLSLNGQ